MAQPAARPDADSATPVADRCPVAVAEALLTACKLGEPTDRYTAALAAATDAELRPIREDRRNGLAFWLNCYNAGTQLLLREHPERYESPLRMVRFFLTPAITVGGADLALDRIENGVLRGGRSKYGLGYLPKFLVTTFEHRYRLADCDPRIHFALNCGAESCPPIRAYKPGRIDEQLDIATRSYLDSTVGYDSEAGTVSVPRVFLWFRGDFDGRSGIYEFLRRYDAIPAGATPSLDYRAWDWAKAAGTFVE